MQEEILGESAKMVKEKNFITRLFNGDISLAVTYWVFGVIIGNVIFGTLYSVIDSKYIEIVAKIGTLPIIIFIVITFAYNFFVLIAIYRSAVKYDGNKIWSILARILVIINTIFSIGVLVATFVQITDSNMFIKRDISMLNKNLPKMIDKDTRLDKVILIDKDISFNYTMVNLLAADLDIPKLESIMAPNIKLEQCQNDGLKPILDEGRKLIYVYVDKEANAITKIIVSKEDCLTK
jgi:cell division protein FtsB